MATGLYDLYDEGASSQTNDPVPLLLVLALIFLLK